MGQQENTKQARLLIDSQIQAPDARFYFHWIKNQAFETLTETQE